MPQRPKTGRDQMCAYPELVEGSGSGWNSPFEKHRSSRSRRPMEIQKRARERRRAAMLLGLKHFHRASAFSVFGAGQGGSQPCYGIKDSCAGKTDHNSQTVESTVR